jgi:excisionase family DNA binding protein
MNTSISQLELRGMVAGDDARAEDSAPAKGTREAGAASAGQVCPRESHRDEIGSRTSATEKPKTKRNAGEAGAVEMLLNFAEAARVLGISLRQFRRLVDGGRVAFVKVSERTPRIRPSELQRFLEASAVKYSEVQS